MSDNTPGSSHLSVNRAELKKLDTDTCNILSQFEKTREWADLTNCLIKLNRILTNSTIPHIPYKEIICKRLAQCLNHQLPTGVHIRALEVYGSILAKTTTESLSNDLALFSTGLFPFFSYSSHSVRPHFLEIIDRYFLPLGPKLLPCLIGLLICILPGLEDDKSETYGMVYEMVEKISRCVPERYFMRSLWLIFKRAAKIRLPTLYVISNKLSPGVSQLSEDRLDSLLPDRNELVLNSLIAASQDDSMITLRELMNFMSKYLLLNSDIFKYHSKAALCRNFLRLLRKRDWSLTRRIYQWLFNTNDLNESVETIDLSYFNNHSKSVIITAVKDLLKMRVNTLEEVIMPLKIVVTLISDIEVSVIANQLMPVLCIPILKYICDKIDDPDWHTSIIQESKIIFNTTLTSPYVVFNSIIEQFNKLFLNECYNSVQEWNDILDLSNIYLDEIKTLTMIETVLCGLFMLLENALYKLLKLEIKTQVKTISHILRYISAILARVETFINGEYSHFSFENDLNYLHENKEINHLIEVQKSCNDRIFKYLNHFYINSLTHFDNNNNKLTSSEVSVLDLLNNLAVRFVSIDYNMKTLPIIETFSEYYEVNDNTITNNLSDLTLYENNNTPVNKYITNNLPKKTYTQTNFNGITSDMYVNGDIEGIKLDGWIMCLLKCSLSSDPMIFCRGIRTFIQIINLPRKAHLKKFFSVSIFHLRNIIMQLWNSLVDRFSSFHSEIVLLLLHLIYSVPEISEEAEELMVKDLTSRDVDVKIDAILRFGVLIKYLHIHAPEQLFFSEAIGFILDAVEESDPKLHYYARAFLSESIYMLSNLLDPILLFLTKFNPKNPSNLKNKSSWNDENEKLTKTKGKTNQKSETESKNMTEVVRRFRHLSSIIGREGQAILDLMQRRQVPIDLLKCVQGEDLFTRLSEILESVPPSQTKSESNSAKNYSIDKSADKNMDNMEDGVNESSFIKHILKDTLKNKQFTINSEMEESSSRQDSILKDSSSVKVEDNNLISDLISLNSQDLKGANKSTNTQDNSQSVNANEDYYTPSSSIVNTIQNPYVSNKGIQGDRVSNSTSTPSNLVDKDTIFPRLYDPSYTCYSDESIYNYLDLVIVITLKYICLNVDLSSLILTSTSDDLLLYQQIITHQNYITNTVSSTTNTHGNFSALNLHTSNSGVLNLNTKSRDINGNSINSVSMDDSTMLLRCTAIDFMKLFVSCLQPSNLSIEVSCLISKYLLLILYHFHLKDQHIIQTQMIYLLKLVMDRCHQESTTISKPVSLLIGLSNSLSKLPFLKTPTNQNIDLQTPKSQSSFEISIHPDHNLHSIYTSHLTNETINTMNSNMDMNSSMNLETIINMDMNVDMYMDRYVSSDQLFENEYYSRNLIQGIQMLPNITKDFENPTTYLSPIYIINVANVRKKQLKRLTKLSEIEYFEKVLHICIGNAARSRCIHLLQSYIDFAIYNLKYLSGPETVKYASHFILELCTQLTSYKNLIGTTGMFYYIRALYFMFNHVTENYKTGTSGYSGSSAFTSTSGFGSTSGNLGTTGFTGTSVFSARESKTTGKNLGLTDESGRPYFSIKKKNKNPTDSAGFPHLDVTHLVQSCIQTLIYAHANVNNTTHTNTNSVNSTNTTNINNNGIMVDVEKVSVLDDKTNSYNTNFIVKIDELRDMKEHEMDKSLHINDEMNLVQKVSLENVTNQVIRLFKLLYIKLPYHFIKACIQLWDQSNSIIPEFNTTEMYTSMNVMDIYTKNETKNFILLILSNIPQVNSRLLLSYTLDMLESFCKSSEFKNANGYLILNTNVRESSLSEFVYAITTSKMIPQADVDSTFAELQRWVGLVLHYPKQPSVFLWVFQTLLKYEKITVYNYSKVLTNTCKRLFNDLIMVVIYQACGLYSQKICHWLPQANYDTLLPVPLQVQLINSNYYFSNRILHSFLNNNFITSPITLHHQTHSHPIIHSQGMSQISEMSQITEMSQLCHTSSVNFENSTESVLIHYDININGTGTIEGTKSTMDVSVNTTKDSEGTKDTDVNTSNIGTNTHTKDTTKDTTVVSNTVTEENSAQISSTNTGTNTPEDMYLMDLKSIIRNKTSSLLTSRAPSVSENDPNTTPKSYNAEVVCENALALLIFFSYEILQLNRRTPITNIIFQSLHKSLTSHILPLMLDRQTLQQRYFTLVLLRYLPYSLYEVPLSTIKKSVLEYINSAEFFRIDRNCLNVLVEIFRQVVEEDCKGSTDMMTRLDLYTNPPHMNVFSNKSSSLTSRLKYLKRLAFVLYASEHDTFSSHISNIIERLAETTRTFKNDTLRAKCLFVMRVLLAKTSQDNLTVLWPVLLSELIKIFRNTTEQLYSFPSDVGISDLNSEVEDDDLIDNKLNKCIKPNSTFTDDNRVVETVTDGKLTESSRMTDGKLTESSRMTDGSRMSGRSSKLSSRVTDRESKIENSECPADNKNALLIEAVKIVDIACSLRLNEFLVYQWMFIDDLTSNTTKDLELDVVNDFKPFLMMVEQMCPEEVRDQLKNLIWRSNEQYKFFGGKPVKSHNWENKNTRELLNKSIENELIEDESQVTPIKPINLHQIFKIFKRFQ